MGSFKPNNDYDRVTTHKIMFKIANMLHQTITHVRVGGIYQAVLWVEHFDRQLAEPAGNLMLAQHVRTSVGG